MLKRLFTSLAIGFISAGTVSAPVEASTSNMLTSWYGPGFHGRLTANGEVYNQMANTAAHKTLPFGTKLLVCYDGCVVVRINDRGPFIGARELDLSYGAASKIGLIHPGVAWTSISYI